jgi:CO/xanthine dehydrogenase Mo-binding subunit
VLFRSQLAALWLPPNPHAGVGNVFLHITRSGVGGIHNTVDLLYFPIMTGLFLALTYLRLAFTRQSPPVWMKAAKYAMVVSVALMCGSAEMGQGSSTVLPQIAAAEIGVPLESVRLVNSDTSAVSYDRSTGASRTTTVMGLAIQRAAADLREQLVDWARELHPGVAGDVERSGVRIDGRLLTWGEIVRGWFGGAGGEAIGRGYVRAEGVTAELPLFWEVGCLGVEVSVDADTGQVRVERLVTVGDVGRAIHPQLAEQQDVGGAVMGMGIALREELRYDEQSMVNGNLWDYRVPRTTDVPTIEAVLAERGEGIGPYGAKGGGEAAVNPIGPAVANAVSRAIGRRIRCLPVTPERVWQALQGEESGRP